MSTRASTALVGVRCSNGIVIGADSSGTTSNSSGARVVEIFNEKIHLVDDSAIVACTGSVGLSQRLIAGLERVFPPKADFPKVELGKELATVGTLDFQSTSVNPNEPFSTIVAFQASQEPVLCELAWIAGAKD